MPKKYCISCGVQKRLRWPKYDPECCAMRCAANQYMMYRSVAPFEGAFCPDCGDTETDCAGLCDGVEGGEE